MSGLFIQVNQRHVQAAGSAYLNVQEQLRARRSDLLSKFCGINSIHIMCKYGEDGTCILQNLVEWGVSLRRQCRIDRLNAGGRIRHLNPVRLAILSQIAIKPHRPRCIVIDESRQGNQELTEVERVLQKEGLSDDTFDES